MATTLAFKAFQKLLLQPYLRQTRGMTLGTRTAVIGEGQRILLVRHTYAPGWVLPGGGVERGETLCQAAVRELREEAAVVAEEEPVLFGMYLNDANFAGDHVACFVVRKFRQEPFKPDLEIAEAGFFDCGSPPDGTTAGTRRRISEIAGEAARSAHW